MTSHKRYLSRSLSLAIFLLFDDVCFQRLRSRTQAKDLSLSLVFFFLQLHHVAVCCSIKKQQQPPPFCPSHHRRSLTVVAQAFCSVSRRDIVFQLYYTYIQYLSSLCYQTIRNVRRQQQGRTRNQKGQVSESGTQITFRIIRVVFTWRKTDVTR